MSRILFFGLDNMMSMVLIIPSLISAPIAIILGCYFVARVNTHIFYFIAVVVYIIICCAVIDQFNASSAKHQGEYDSVQSLKSIKIEEFFDNISSIHTNSLGRCLKQRF